MPETSILKGIYLGLSITLSCGTWGILGSQSFAQEIGLSDSESLITRPNQTLSEALHQSATEVNYLLGPGDEIAISVIGYPEFEDVHVVLPDGTISLPLLGSVQAEGQTLAALSLSVQEQLGNSFLVNPVVDLSLLTLRPLLVTVSGEVYRPGPLELGSTQDDGTGPTLTSALTAAGGITNKADIREVTVSRRQMNGRTQVMTFNLWDGLVSEPETSNLILRDGDAIWIPALTSEDNIDRSLLARSSIAPDNVRVRVVGEVTRPGEVEVPPNSSLSSAVAIAGGPTEDAKLSQVAFIRMGDTGEITSETVDLRNLTDTFQVRDGDVLIVPKTGVSTGLDFIARLLGPFNFIFNNLIDNNNN